MLQVNRPMGLGELLDGAFRAYRAHFSRLVLLAAIFFVPVGVATTLLFGFAMGGFTDLLFASSSDATIRDLAPSFLTLFAYLGLILLSYVAMTLAYVSLTAYIVPILQGEQLTIKGSIRRGLRRLLPFIGMAVLAGLAIGALTLGLYLVLLLLFVVFAAAIGLLSNLGNGGGVAAVGFMVIGMFLYLAAIVLVFIPVGLLTARWIAAPTVVVAENLGPKGALDRSWQLTRNNMWRCFGYLTLIVLFNFLVIGLPISLLQALLAFFVTDQLYGWLTGLMTGLSYFVNILWYPIQVLALVLLYFDLRVRNESLDLELRIRQLEESAPPALDS
jgi:hypothetical protein